MVIHNICKIIGWHPVPLNQHLVVEGLILYGDITEYFIMEGRRSFMRNPLANYIRFPLCNTRIRLLAGKRPAGIIGTVKLTGVFFTFRFLTEAAIGTAFFHEKIGVLFVHRHTFALDIRCYRATDIRTLIVFEMAFFHCPVDDIRRTFNQTAAVSILNTENKFSPGMPGNQIGIQRRAQVAHVHIACWGRRKPCAHFTDRNFLFIGFVPCHVFHSTILHSL